MNLIWLGDVEDALNYEAGMRQCIQKFGSLNPPAGEHLNRLQMDEDEEDDNPVGLTMHGALAILDVSGGMTTNTNRFTRWFGMVTYEDIKERLNMLAEDSDVGAVMMNYNTNGGSAEGTGQLADYIRLYSNSVKPVFSYTGSKAHSAGYWLFCGGARQLMDEDAKVGSVGCITVHFEMTEMYKQIGIKPTVFRSAPLKALGSPYEKLSEKASAQLQKDTDFWHNRFVNGISKLMGLEVPVVSKTIATGATFEATEAKELGMIDGVKSFEAALEVFSKAAEKKKPDPASVPMRNY